MNRDPKRGQVWERRNGSRFTIENIRGNYAYYWLSSGSRPQSRSIRIDLLLTRYTLYQDVRP